MDIAGLVKAAFSALASLFDWRAKEAANKPDKDKAETLERATQAVEKAQAGQREEQRKLEAELKEGPPKHNRFGDDW